MERICVIAYAYFRLAHLALRVLALSEQSYDIIFPRQREENSQ